MPLILYSPGIWVTHTIFYPRSAHSDTPRDSGSPGLHCSHSTLWYWIIRRQVAQWLFQEQARLAYHDTGNLYWQTPSMRLSSRGCLLKGIPFLPLKECTRHTDNVLGNAWSMDVRICLQGGFLDWNAIVFNSISELLTWFLNLYNSF